MKISMNQYGKSRLHRIVLLCVAFCFTFIVDSSAQCSNLTLDNSWRIESSLDAFAFCDSVTLDLSALTDSIYPNNISYQWQSRVGSSGPWTDISSNATFTTTVNSTRNFQCIISCGSSQITLNQAITISVPTPGSISGASTICYNQDASNITSVEPGTSSIGSVSYVWENQTGAGLWTTIPSATSATFNPPQLTQTTKYRRTTLATVDVNTSCLSVTTNEVVISVQNQLLPGAILSDGTICNGATPSTLNGSAAAASGIVTYFWESQIGSGSWTNLSTQTEDYSPGALTQTTSFRRQISTLWNGTTCVSGYASVTITVLEAVSGGTISSAQTICNGTIPAPLNGSSFTASNGVVTFQWEKQVGSGSWSNADGVSNTEDYTLPALTTTTNFRRRSILTFNSVSCEATSNSITISVQSSISSGTVGSNQTICFGATAAAFSGSAVTGGSGNLSYTWQILNGATWENITGAINQNYTPAGSLTQSVSFRRIANYSWNSVLCSSSPSNVVTVTVRAAVDPGSISGIQTVCYQTAPTAFTSTSPSNIQGTLSYQWQINTNASTFPEASWVDISGATSALYSPPASSMTSDRQFRRKAIDTLNSLACSSNPTSAIQVSVVPQLTAQVSGLSSTTLCRGTLGTFQIQGSPNALVNFSIGGVAQSTVLNSSGSSSSFNVGTSTVGINSMTIELTSIQTLSGTICNRNLIGVAGSSATVTIIDLPSATIVGSTAHCSGSNYTLTFNGSAGANVTYTMNSSVQPVVAINGSGIGSVVINNLSANAAFQITQVALGSCVNTTSGSVFSVTVTTTPSVTIAPVSGDNVLCQGETVNLTTNISGATGYTWKQGNTTVGTGQTYPAGVGSYSVTVVNGTCSGTSSSYTVSLSNVVPVSISPNGPLSFCDGGNVQLSASTTCSNCSYLWSDASNSSSSAITVSSTLSNITVTTTNGDGCTAQSTAVNVVEKPIPQVAISPASLSLCAGSSGTVLASGAQSYSWSSSLGASASVQIGSVSATYTVTGTTNGCSNNASVSVSEIALPNSTMSILDQSICTYENTSAVFDGSPVDAGIDIFYTVNNGSQLTLPADGNGDYNLVLGNLPAGTYTYRLVKLEKTVNGVTCSRNNINQIQTLTVNPKPIVVSPSSAVYCNDTPIVPITLSGTNVTSYHWQAFPVLGIQSGTGAQIIGTVSSSSTDSDTSFFSLWGVSNAACYSDTASFELIVTPGPQILPIASPKYCNGEEFSPILVSTSVSSNISWRSINTLSQNFEIDNVGSSTIDALQNTIVYPDNQTGLYTESIEIFANAIEGGCPANPYTLEIKVFPSPTSDNLDSIVLCPEDDYSVALNGDNDNNFYSWYFMEGDQGAFATPDSTMVEQLQLTTVNVDSLEKSFTLGIRPFFDNGGKVCRGEEESMLVIVNPRPVIQVSEEVTICFNSDLSADAVGLALVPSSNSTFTISESSEYLSGTAPTARTNVNNTSSADTTFVSFTPTYTSNGHTCPGNAQQTNVILYPEASVDYNLDFASGTYLCDEETLTFTFSSLTISPVSNWIVNASGTGVNGENGCTDNCETLQNTLTINQSTDTISTVIYTIQSQIEDCAVNQELIYVDVHAKPLPASYESSSNSCSGFEGVELIASGDTNQDVYFIWTSANDIAYGGINGQVAVLFPNNQTSVDFEIISTTGYGCSESSQFSLELPANPNAVDYQVVQVGEGVNTMLSIIPAIEGQTYQWGISNPSWTESILDGEVGQNLFLGNSPGATNYFVDVTLDDCTYRVYLNNPVNSPISIENNLIFKEENFQVFPNPFVNEIRLVRSIGHNAVSLRLIDCSGKVVGSNSMVSGQGLLNWNLENTPTGVYILEVLSSDYYQPLRIVKQ
jgi:hypothetical protein